MGFFPFFFFTVVQGGGGSGAVLCCYANRMLNCNPKAFGPCERLPGQEVVFTFHCGSAYANRG